MFSQGFEKTAIICLLKLTTNSCGIFSTQLAFFEDIHRSISHVIEFRFPSYSIDTLLN